MKRWFSIPRLPALVAESYGVAVVLSVLLHLSMLGVLAVSWDRDSTIKRPPPVPISAALVALPETLSVSSESQQKAELQRREEANRLAEARKKAEAKKQAEARKVAEAKKAADAKKRAERERQKALARKQEAEKKRQLQREQEEARRRQQEQERLQKEQQEKAQQELEQQRREQEALEQAIALEQLAMQDAQQLARDQLEQAKYAALIKSLTSQYWNRPPSARNNMMAEIRISLSPVGDVLGITMVKSSGNDEFDRSVIQAIRQAAPFSELKNLERRIFDQYFRRITFRFRPEDLVR